MFPQSLRLRTPARPRADYHRLRVRPAFERLEDRLVPALAAVSGLTVLADSLQGISLQWSPVSGAANYQVERSTNGSDFTPLVTTPHTSFSDSSVKPFTTYYYEVIANGSGGPSPPTMVLATTPPVAALPAPWSYQDVGRVGGAGASSYANGTFTVIGSGADIYGNADAFQFVSQPVSGNVTITAEVNYDAANANYAAKAGVMLRADTSAGSAEVYMGIGNYGAPQFEDRGDAGQSTYAHIAPAVTLPYWVRLVEWQDPANGPQVLGYYSRDGIRWTLHANGLNNTSSPPNQYSSSALGTTFYAGLAVAAHDDARLLSATFSHVSVVATPAPPTGVTASKVSASQVNLSWTAPAGGAVAGYNVYRSTVSGLQSATPINRSLITTTAYSDHTANLAPAGSGYYYTVESVVSVQGEYVFGNPSAEAAVITPLATREAGTWSEVKSQFTSIDGYSTAAMVLLSDGTVLTSVYGYPNWEKLTPDSSGSYTNGTWSDIAPMNQSRLYHATDLLPNGDLFVAGGETEANHDAEIYDPVANQWTMAPPPPASVSDIGDAPSNTLPDGSVLLNPVYPVAWGTLIYNPNAPSGSNPWQSSTLNGYPDETYFVKLPDHSILTLDFNDNQQSERFIPASGAGAPGRWVADARVPVSLFYQGETGAATLLPNGKVFFLGGNGRTEFYTPSGSSAPGTWSAGPKIPWGLGAYDAPLAMMPDGNVLCVVGPQTYEGPATYIVYDSRTNSWVATPDTITDPTLGPTDVHNGTQNLNVAHYITRFLDLPDGGVLVEDFNNQLFEFKPSGTPVAAGMPVVKSIVPQPDGSYLLTGTNLNGTSEGAAYGDDDQMATNYPLVRLVSSSGTVTYARTYNWSNTGVRLGSTQETVEFTLPAGVSLAGNTLYVVANGIASHGYVLPTITVSPASRTVKAGATATFTATMSGTPAPKVQWYVRTNGGTFKKMSGATGVRLTVTATAALDGARYEAIATNAAGAKSSAPATLTVQFRPVITTQPKSQTVPAGTQVTFSPMVSANPAVTAVQWYRSTDGGYTFTKIQGATSPSYTTPPVTRKNNGSRYRAVYTNDIGSTTTTAATLTVTA
jgi:hypothetical protein